MKINVWAPLEWTLNRIGFRESFEYHRRTRAHQHFRRASVLWFEFLKRLAILAALNATAKKAPIVWPVYWISMLMILAPVLSWVDRWDLDLLTRKPTVYRPEFDGEVTTPVAPDKPPVWAYSLPIGLVGTLVFGVGLNLLVNLVVLRLSMALAGVKPG